MRALLIVLAIVVTAACARRKPPPPAPAETPSAAAAGVARARPTLDAWIASTDATHYDIDNDVVTQALLGGLGGELVVRQVAGGYRVEDFPPGSLFARLGLAKGDVVKAINEVALADFDAVYTAYADVRVVRRVQLALERDGKAVTLDYRMKSGPPLPAAAGEPLPAPREPTPEELRAAAALDQQITRIDESTYEITPEVLDQLFSLSAAGARSARIVPSIKDGQPNGFKLYAIRPASVYAHVGFMNGDTITAVNGKALSDPATALEVFSKLKGQKRIVFSLLRRGQEAAVVLKVRSK